VLSEEDGQAQGSGRGIPVFHLLDALESMPDLFTRFGGHRQAAGVSLAAELVPEFRRRLNAYAGARLTPADFQPQLLVDAVVSLRDLTSGPAVQELLAMAPFGFGNPPPVLAILGAELASAPVVMKEKHLRVHLRQDGRSLFPKAWNFAARAADFPMHARLDVVFAVEEDTYGQDRGFANWAAILRDVRPST
jgi:single-stranded-DNA-specific exonuclease